MTQLFRILVLGPLILLFGLVGWPLVWASVKLLELYGKLRHEP